MGCDEDGYIDWMYSVFGDCVYNERDIMSFIIGLVSLVCWIVVGWPQMRDNYLNQSGESVSIPFLLFWGIGDATNIIGCILTDALPTQLFIAIWYGITVFVLIFQVYYYRWRAYVNMTKGVRINDEYQTSSSGYVNAFLFSFLIISGLPFLGGVEIQDSQPHEFSSRHLLSVGSIFSSSGNTGGGDDDELGIIMGWISAAFYVASRLPQIYKNYATKSVEGLSLTMFVFCLLGNITYSASIFLRELDADYLDSQLPWVVGSLGTLGFDVMIYHQFRLYGQNSYQPIKTTVEDE